MVRIDHPDVKSYQTCAIICKLFNFVCKDEFHYTVKVCSLTFGPWHSNYCTLLHSPPSSDRLPTHCSVRSAYGAWDKSDPFYCKTAPSQFLTVCVLRVQFSTMHTIPRGVCTEQKSSSHRIHCVSTIKTSARVGT